MRSPRPPRSRKRRRMHWRTGRRRRWRSRRLRPGSLPETPPVEVAAARSAARVERHGTHGAVRVGVTRRRRHDVKLAARREPSLAGALADEVGGAAKAQTRLAREALCAWAAEQQMRRSFHHGTRKHDRIADAADENDATGVDLDRVGGRAPQIRAGASTQRAWLIMEAGSSCGCGRVATSSQRHPSRRALRS